MAVAASRHLIARMSSDIGQAQRVYREVTKGMTCRAHYHVKHSSCIAGYLDMVLACAYGSGRFFFVYNLLYVAANYKKALALDKQFYKYLLQSYVRSIVAGSAIGSTYVLTGCILTRLINGFNFWISSLLPGILGGYFILLEHPVRRRGDMNVVENVAVQYLYQRCQLAGFLPNTRMGEALLFMVVNSMLMYLLTTTPKTPTVFWFYIPKRANNKMEEVEQKHCCVSHNGSCWGSAIKVTLRYVAITAGLQACKLILTGGQHIFRAPSMFLRQFFSKNTAGFVTSIGGYIFLYKVLRCMLAKCFGRDYPRHSALAGLVAGAMFWIKPNSTIMSSALVALITLLYHCIPKNIKPSEKWMMEESAFALSTGLLFHARCMDMKHCPDFMFRMTDIATHYRSKRIEESLLQSMVRLNLI